MGTEQPGVGQDWSVKTYHPLSMYSPSIEETSAMEVKIGRAHV